MKKTTLALFACLLLPALCWGQDITLPEFVNVKPGRLVKLAATVKDPTLLVFWDTAGLTPGLDFDFIKIDSASVILLFPNELQGGKYKIGAIVATDKNKLQMAYTTITVSGTPTPPGPTPPNPPVPPGPVVPADLVAAVQAGITADGQTPANVASAKKIAAVAHVIAGKANDPTLKTSLDVYALWKASVGNVVQPADVPILRGTIGGYLNKKLPGGNMPLDAAMRDRIATEFHNIAIALETISK